MMIKLEKIKLKQTLSLNFQFWMHSQWGSNFLEENQSTRMRVCGKDPIEEIQILVRAEIHLLAIHYCLGIFITQWGKIVFASAKTCTLRSKVPSCSDWGQAYVEKRKKYKRMLSVWGQAYLLCVSFSLRPISNVHFKFFILTTCESNQFRIHLQSSIFKGDQDRSHFKVLYDSSHKVLCDNMWYISEFYKSNQLGSIHV